MKGEEARHQGQASIIIIVLIWKLHSMLRCAPSLPVSLESQHLRAPHIPVTILHRSQPSHNVPLLKVFLFIGGCCTKQRLSEKKSAVKTFSLGLNTAIGGMEEQQQLERENQ